MCASLAVTPDGPSTVTEFADELRRQPGFSGSYQVVEMDTAVDASERRRRYLRFEFVRTPSGDYRVAAEARGVTTRRLLQFAEGRGTREAVIAGKRSEHPIRSPLMLSGDLLEFSPALSCLYQILMADAVGTEFDKQWSLRREEGGSVVVYREKANASGITLDVELHFDAAYQLVGFDSNRRIETHLADVGGPAPLVDFVDLKLSELTSQIEISEDQHEGRRLSPAEARALLDSLGGPVQPTDERREGEP